MKQLDAQIVERFLNKSHTLEDILNSAQEEEKRFTNANVINQKHFLQL